jgi:hypothetical protein
MNPILYLTPVKGGMPFAPKVLSLSAGERTTLGRQFRQHDRVQGVDNGWFDAQVLSRKHAQVWEENGKVLGVQPVGTFVALLTGAG